MDGDQYRVKSVHTPRNIESNLRYACARVNAKSPGSLQDPASVYRDSMEMSSIVTTPRTSTYVDEPPLQVGPTVSKTLEAMSSASWKPLACTPKPSRKCSGASKHSPGAVRTPSRARASHIGRASRPSNHQGNATGPPRGRVQPIEL